MANALSSHQRTSLFESINRLMQEDEKRVRCGFDKASGFVNGIFSDLSSIDVRFQFDPVSLDDCRCEKVSTNIYNVICNLKHLPYGSLILSENLSTGAFQVRLDDNYNDSFDGVCWEDVCTPLPSGERLMDTTKIMVAIYEAITTVLNCERQEGAMIVCQLKPTHLLLAINLYLTGVYKFHLFPSIKVNRKCKTLKQFDEKIKNTFELLKENDTVENIHIVAQPMASCAIWGLTFNDLENRLFNLEKFACLRHCFFALSLLQKKHLHSNGLPSLSTYNLQLATLKELMKTPQTEAWNVTEFPKRLEGLLKSVKVYLNKKTNRNIFTEVNLFRNCYKRDLKILSKEFAHIRKFYKDILHQ